MVVQMRVLMFGWEFPPYQVGGLATATLGLVKGLLRQGVQVTLVVPFPAHQSEESSLAGLQLVSASGELRRLRRRIVPSLLTPYLTADQYAAVYARSVQGPGSGSLYGGDLYAEVERFARVAAELAADEPHDLIDTHDWMTYAAGRRAQQVSGRPWVAHIHATEFDRSGDRPNPQIAHLEHQGLAEASLIIANSHQLQRQVSRRYRIAAGKIKVIHWGIDEDRPEYHLQPPLPFTPETAVVLFLGRVTRQKGPDYFIEVARRVADYLPEAHFIVAGGGDLLPQVMERAAQLGLAERVHFTGPLQGADVFRVLRLADLCVMPSVSEPFGLVALESLKSGTPCLVPRNSGVAEVLQNALKIEFWDIDEMTNKIVAILKHRELQAELGERGLQETSAARLGLDEPARRTIEVYRQAVRLQQERRV